MNLTRRTLLGGLCMAGAALGSKAWAQEVRQLATVQGVGVPQGIVQILYNENPLGPSPLAIQAAQEALGMSNRYPMLGTVQLVDAIHSQYGLPFEAPPNANNLGALFGALAKSNVILGVGSTEILRAAALAYGMDGGELIEAIPAYGEMGDAVESMLGGRVKRVQVPLTDDYRHDIDAMIKAVTAKTRIVVVTNPNNPTGTALRAAEITKLADALDPKILLVIDEAYIDFATDPLVKSMAALALQRPNILVTRTFSKIHGMAGLRVGYGLASQALIQKLVPFTMNLLNTNTPAVAAAVAALKDQAHQQKSRAMANEAKEQIMKRFGAYGYQPVASQASFVWIKAPQNTAPLVAKLAQQGVYIGGGARWQLPNYLRISVGLPTEMTALFTAMERV